MRVSPALRCARGGLAGVVLGICLALKPFTGLFLVLFLLLRRWRLVRWYLGAFLACTLLAHVVIGPEAQLSYLEVLQDVTWYAASRNASILGFATRIFGGSGNVALVEAPHLASLVELAAAVLGLAALFRVAGRHPEPAERRALDLGFALTVPLMLLLSPLGWIYYFPYLLIPLVVVFEASKGLDGAARYRAGIAVAWLLGTVPHFLVRSEKISEPALIFTYPAFYCASLVLTAGLLFALAMALRRSSERS